MTPVGMAPRGFVGQPRAKNQLPMQPPARQAPIPYRGAPMRTIQPIRTGQPGLARNHMYADALMSKR